MGEHVLAGPVSGAEGARRVLAVLQAFSPQQHTLTARELADITAIPLPSMYRYIALLRDMGMLVGDDHGAYHLSPRFISLARAAEAAVTDWLESQRHLCEAIGWASRQIICTGESPNAA